MNEILWELTDEQKQKSKIFSFMKAALGKENASYAELYQFSVDNSDKFWPLVWDACNIIGNKSDCLTYQAGSHFLTGEWFPGATLNFAENLLYPKTLTDENKTALTFRGEDVERRAISYRELREQVRFIRSFFRKQNLKPGDVVAAIAPNTPEAITTMLAAASLGIGWCSVAPEFGPTGILERFSQIKPKLLITGDRYLYKGKEISLIKKAEEVNKALPSVESVLVIPYGAVEKDVPKEWSTYSSLLNGESDDSSFEQFPFSHPLYYLFTSGTTGKPKGLIHSAGGTLLEHKKELELHVNLTEEDVIFYQTTCAWMMWNWLVSSLASGSTIVLYDGFPLIEDNRYLLKVAEEEKITVFGTNPGFLRVLEKEKIQPKDEFQLAPLRSILTTGSRLHNDQFDYVYNSISSDLCLSSISGGTDIIGCFALGNPILPVRRGELQCRSLGYKVEAFDDQGNSLVSEPGELVCTKPFPSMPVGFVNDPDFTRYKKSYCERFENIWHHGDKITITEEGGVIVHDRSDDTLNVSGVRIGPAEISRQVLTFKEISDCIAVAQKWKEDSRIILFVVMAENFELTDELIKKMNQQLKTEESPRHIPAKILTVPALPKTMSGKISASAIRACINGEKAANKDALSNPEVLEFFTDRGELKSS